MKILNYLLLLIPAICPGTSATAATFEIKPQIFNGTGADSFCDALRQEIRTSALAAAKAEAKILTETQIKALQNSACTFTNRIVQRNGRYDINYHIAAIRVPTSRKNESNLYVFITSSQGFSTSGFPPKAKAEPGITTGSYYGAYNLMSAFTKTYVGPYASTLSYVKAPPPQDSSVTTSSAATASVGGSVNVSGNGLNAQIDIGYSHSTTRISSNGDYDRTQNFFESIDNKRYLVTRLTPSIGAPLLGAVSSVIQTGKGAGAVSKVLTGNWTPDLSTIYVIEGIDEKLHNNFPVVIRTGAQLMQAEKYKRCTAVSSPFGGGAMWWSCDTSTYRELYNNKVEDVTELSITTTPDNDSGLVLNIE